MQPTLLLDTHAWVWWLRGAIGGSKLSTYEVSALDALPAAQRPALCDISLWEVAMLVGVGSNLEIARAGILNAAPVAE